MIEKLDRPVIVTGLSGAGISSVLKAMEDLKFEVFDNFPLVLIPQLFVDESDAEKTENGIAIGLDTRTRGFSTQAVFDMVQAINGILVFITCDDDVLFKRFSETRRRHPMASEKSLSHGIKAERALLQSLYQKADVLIDSSSTSVHDIRHVLEANFALRPEDQLAVSLISFGFRNGVPREANIVMDVRFLKNPHWDSALKSKTGLDSEVGDYIRQDSDFEGFLDNFKGLVKPLVPRYAEEGKSYLSIAIGCTGGRHRSVYTVETLKEWFEAQGVNVFVDHRDLPK